MDKAREQARRKLGCEIDKELFTSSPENGFDVVTAWQVIEHVEKPGELFEAVHKNLKPGGIFAVSTVNLDSWQARLFGSNWLHLDPPRHLWIGRRKEVENLLEKHGFKIISRRWNHLEFGPVGWIDSFINLFDTRRDRLLKCLKLGFPGVANKITWVMAALLTPPSLVLSALESLINRPATFELYAKKAASRE
jgi:SAM-dependent methyltransferase